MVRRDFLQGVAAAAGSAAFAQNKPRPNIIYLHSHDTGRYLQPYGHAVPAPHFQKLAEQGILFRQAFNAGPTCSPSRAALLTGCCPHVNGMYGLAHRGFSLKDYSQVIVHPLRAAGYHTELFGIQHIARDPNVIGYDRVARPKSMHVEDVTPGALNFLNSAPKQPFFIDIGFQETHREYRKPGPQEDVRYTPVPNPMPDTPETRYDFASFKATARVLDDAVGAILKAVDDNGLAGNTLIISTTDHGIAFPAMKCNLTDHGMGVSLIMRGPGGFSGGKVVDGMVSHLDLYPTVCDLLEIEHPKWLEGKSLLPLLRGEVQQLHDEVFSEVNYHAAYEPKRAVRTERYKYIRHFDNRNHPNLPNCDDGPSKKYWLDKGWRDKSVAHEQLFDLVFDANEVNNLAHDDSHAAILADMRGRLDRWMKATKDPLLHGPVALPAGAVVNDPNGTSPRERPTALKPV
jgi:arylsulfatase A-like enzyme